MPSSAATDHSGQESSQHTPLASSGADEFAEIIGGSPSTETPSQSTSTQTAPNPNIPSKSAESTQTPTTETTPPASGTGQTQQPAQGQQTPATQQTPNQASLEDVVNKLADKLAAPLAQQRQQQQQPAAPAKTPEQERAEFNQRYGIVDYTPEHITQLLGQDPVKAAAVLNAIQTNSLTAALRMANDVIEARLTEMKDQFVPHVESWKQYQAERQAQKNETDFYAAYPDLANEKEMVNEMRDAIVAKVQTGQLQFTSKDQIFKAVADSTRKILSRMNTQSSGGSSGGQTQTPKSTTQPSQRQMTVATATGRSGTGQAAAKSDVEEVFGSDAV